ncbi:NSFL1 cofactor p47-like [Oscarella lobularis]|uniref:NSFL1 cofactor p47-like n=1 Tax=Oscarella lobularis TaxID=121494 RepID=UPI003313796D
MRRQAAAKSNAFRGAGYRLGETEGNTVKIVGEPLASASKQGQIRQTLRFWQNGFTIDDGPLRDGSADADRLFLHNVARGMILQELIAAAQGDEVEILNVEDRRQENYAPPKKTLKAFGGEGHKLGSPVPDVVSSVPEPQAEAPVNPPSSVHVDESQPITAMQIRLGNGSRLVQKFNHSHCIRDIRAVVDRKFFKQRALCCVKRQMPISIHGSIPSSSTAFLKSFKFSPLPNGSTNPTILDAERRRCRRRHHPGDLG